MPHIQTTNDEIAKLREQLIQAQRLSSLGVLASSVAHEFNNILTTIINYAKLGKADSDQEARDKAFDKILTAGRKASEITTGMLGLARGTSFDHKNTNLVQLVEEVIVLIGKDLSKHRIELETHFEGEPHADVCAAQIQQIILNLIINARQAMDRGGSIRVSVFENIEEGTAQIEVADTGLGIATDQLRHIFDPFFTTKDGADESGQGGTGIGLSVCRDIIEAHQGRIRVESVEGRGTKFTVKLPLGGNTDVDES